MITHELTDDVGPYTIRTGRTSVACKQRGIWQCEAVMESTAEELQDEWGCYIDPEVACFIDHCNGSFEQAEAMHQEMIELCKYEARLC